MHRRDVLETCDKLLLAGVSHGVIAAGFEQKPDELVQVLSIQTVANRLDKLPQFKFILLDECHHAVANQLRLFIEAQSEASPTRCHGNASTT